MKNRKWTIWLTCIMVAALMITGLGAIAAEYGSQSDPLVTLSYIEQVLLPKAKEDVDEQVQEALEDYEDDLSDQTKSIEKYIDKKLRSFASGDVDEALVEEIAKVIAEQMDTTTPSNAPWAVVDVPAGYRVVCETGVQVILRAGQAGCNGSLADLSNGESPADGSALTANHLYAADGQGNAVFTAQGCTLLISGGYTIQ